MDAWADAYASTHPNVRIETHVPGLASGSGAGIAASIGGQAQIGASDAPLGEGQPAQPRMLNIPLAVSALQIDYHVPELTGKPLRLSGPLLAGIYDGSVSTWDDPRIVALNRGLPLPHHHIVPIRRAEGSGGTYLFTEYLSRTTPQWDKAVHYAFSVPWPVVDTGLTERGNMGVLELCKEVPYSIAYVGITLLAATRADGLGIASLQNRDGEFLQPTPQTIAAAARARAAAMPPDGRMSLVYAPGRDAYPIASLEYAIVRQRQTTTDIAATLRAFLEWAIDPSGGNSPLYLDQAYFVPLPAKAAAVSRSQIATIAGP